MTTYLTIDDWLIEEAMVMGKHRTPKGVVTEALQEYIQRRKQAEIFNVFNKIDYDQLRLQEAKSRKVKTIIDTCV